MLAQVLSRLPKQSHPDMLVGFDTADDAGVFRLDDEHALVQTLDFFTPVVDDPGDYGAIAAANSLSDVYAMGGRPLTAMAITCFPEKGVDAEVLLRILTGGLEKLQEAGVVLVGGHTVSDAEIKFGYSVTGMVHPGRVLANSGARPGDILILTKPLGIGLITTGIKFGETSPDTARRVVTLMRTLNRAASESMVEHKTHAATDITGNGLLGHAFEMAEASKVTLRLQVDNVPYMPEALPLAQSRHIPRTIGTTWEMIRGRTRLSNRVSEPVRLILLDPQTSGGLLIAVAADDADALMSTLERRGVPGTRIGEVQKPSALRIVVE